MSRFLALLAAGASAAPTTELLQQLDVTAYSETCMAAWRPFNAARCWCYTGCALDCNQGGTAGVPGRELHPQWCGAHQRAAEDDCEQLTCEMQTACSDAPSSMAPGLGMIAATADYNCPSAEAAEPEPAPSVKEVPKKTSTTTKSKTTKSQQGKQAQAEPEPEPEPAKAKATKSEDADTSAAATAAALSAQVQAELTEALDSTIKKISAQIGAEVEEAVTDAMRKAKHRK